MTDPIPAQQSACRTLLETHGRWLRTVIRNRIADRSAVEDVFQEVSLALVRTGSQIPIDPAPWLHRVAVRQCLLHRRRSGRRARHELRAAREFQQRTSAGTELGDTEANPLEWILGEEQRAAVRRALDAMGTTDRELLLLKHSEDWSYRQLADHLGVSMHTIEYRLLKARRILRQELVAMQMSEVSAQ